MVSFPYLKPSFVKILHSLQGAFVGCFSSLIFTMWMGFGQTVAKQAQTYDGELFSPSMPRSTEHCPLKFFNTTQPGVKERFEPFTHLHLYEVSYIWYSAIAWLWCVLIGLIISAFRPQDHKKVDRRLITPAFLGFFTFYPRRVRVWIRNYYDEIGSSLESWQDNEKQAGAVSNRGFQADNKMELQ